MRPFVCRRALALLAAITACGGGDGEERPGGAMVGDVLTFLMAKLPP